MRLCFFGDSFVAGVGDEQALGWVGRLMAGRGLTFYNLGIRRDTSTDILARFEDEAARRMPLDMPARICLAFGANDCVQEGSGPRIALEATLANTAILIDKARAYGPTLLLGPLPVLYDGETDERIRILSERMARTANEKGIAFLPLFHWAETCTAWCESALEGDGTHPGGAGYAALAGYIAGWSVLESWLRSADHASAGG